MAGNIYIEYTLHRDIPAMRLVRHHKLCSQDYSELDVESVSLNQICFSENGVISSHFNSSTLTLTGSEDAPLKQRFYFRTRMLLPLL